MQWPSALPPRFSMGGTPFRPCGTPWKGVVGAQA
jgi:hypothetical protein